MLLKMKKNYQKINLKVLQGLSHLYLFYVKALDFENGEPIASNLFRLYDYCKKEVD